MFGSTHMPPNVSKNRMLALVLCVSVASMVMLEAGAQCVLRPPCSTTGMYQLNTSCCLFCPAGHACRLSAITACNVSAGQYQPLTRKADCMNASDCASWQYQSVPGTPTSGRQCTAVRNCSAASEVQTRAPTATTDRACACAEGRISSGTVDQSCLLCSVFMSGCLTCTNDTTCTSCRESFYLSIGRHSECYACTMPGCSRCDRGTASSQVCAECRDTHYADETRICRECTLTGCAQCRTDTQCTQCGSGYVLNGSTCVCATPRCLECNFAGCTLCAPGFEGVACHVAQCADFDSSACVACNSGYTLTVDGTCAAVSDAYCLNFNGSVCSACRDGRPPEKGVCSAAAVNSANKSIGVSVGIAGVGVVVCVVIIVVVINRVLKARTTPDRHSTTYQRPPAAPRRLADPSSWNTSSGKEPLYEVPDLDNRWLPERKEKTREEEPVLYDLATLCMTDGLSLDEQEGTLEHASEGSAPKEPMYDMATGYMDVVG